MRDSKRKVYKGVVVSDSSDKTIVVQVNTYRSHKLYGKRYKYSKKFHTHDEKNQAKIGDTVKIMETRPISKLKHFRLVEVTERKEG